MNELISGKSQVEHVVSVEPLDDTAVLFLENKDGSITKQFVPNKYYVLSNEQIDSSWARLKGDLHYKWGKQFKVREDFFRHRKWLKNKDTWSVYDAKESLMLKDGYTYFKGMDFKEVSVLAVDIETTSLEYTPNDKVLVITNTLRKNGKLEHKMFCYDEFDSLKELIDSWCTWVREKDPSLIVGHNIYSFDLVYLNNCAKNWGTSLKLGRDGSDVQFMNYESKFRKDQTQFLHYHRVRIFGREVVDTYFLSIKHDIVKKKYDSYGLKYIINKEGLEDENRVFYDASQIRNKYKDKTQWEIIKKYCEHDALDALKLYDLMAPAQFYFCQSVPKSFQSIIEGATGSQVNSVIVRSYLQQGHSIPKASETKTFRGAISHGIEGIHKNVISYDVQSLYPSAILQYEIYPKYKDPQKNFLKILEYFTTERLKNKKKFEETGDKKFEDMSNSMKIFINSAYGALSTNGLNFNDEAEAARVTATGRQVLETAIRWATGLSYEDWKKENVEET